MCFYVFLCVLCVFMCFYISFMCFYEFLCVCYAFLCAFYTFLCVFMRFLCHVYMNAIYMTLCVYLSDKTYDQILFIFIYVYIYIYIFIQYIHIYASIDNYLCFSCFYEEGQRGVHQPQPSWVIIGPRSHQRGRD